MVRHSLTLTRIVLVIIFGSFGLYPQPIRAADLSNDDDVLHLLNRTSFGPTAGDVEHVKALGLDAYLEEQLNPSRFTPSPSLSNELDSLSTLNASMSELATKFEPRDLKSLPEEERKEAEKRKHLIVEELSDAKIARAIESPAQLQEVMTDFWFNHFNVFAQKGADKILISAYEREAIRPYVFDKFRNILGATAHHPAMLFYLDNWTNTDPNSPFATRRKQGLNENYAREIMELHTLGVDGGYTQKDVTSLAHILTGWGLGKGRTLSERAVFYFDPKRHDYSDKKWLNLVVHGHGQEEVEQVLDVLAKHPSTAHHISYELAQYFVADIPPESLVKNLTQTYLSTDGDIASMLRVLFHSPEFWDSANTQNKFKPPFRYVVSTLRASGMKTYETKKLQKAIAGMGEPLYHCLTPNGYSNTNDQWMNSDAILKRITFSRVVSRFMNDDDVRHIYLSRLGHWENNTLNSAKNTEPHLKAGMLLSSPEFLYY